MPDTNAPPLDLADVAARIERHAGKDPNPRTGDPKFVDLSRLIDHDAPVLLAEVKRLREGLAEARTTALSEAINAVITQQAKDADRYANSHGHGSWCGVGDWKQCHGAEAQATHERVLAALRALLQPGEAS